MWLMKRISMRTIWLKGAIYSNWTIASIYMSYGVGFEYNECRLLLRIRNSYLEHIFLSIFCIYCNTEKIPINNNRFVNEKIAKKLRIYFD